MAGFSQGGGVGLSLSNWMVHGDPGADIWGMDVSRYGDWATMAYTNAKVRENYSRRFRVRFPNEELPAARGAAHHADLRPPAGAERRVRRRLWPRARAVVRADAPQKPTEEVTFKRSNAHDIVAQECKAVREAVGLMEISTYAKYEVTGPDAETWLSRMLADRMPQQGRIALTPMLNDEGKLIGDFTVAKLAADRFFIIGSGIAENYHMRWWEQHLPAQGVAIRAFGAELVGLSVAGPKSRELLQRLVSDDLSTAAFPFLSFRRMEIGMVPALVGRISFTGDLGYEIWVKPEYQRALYDALLEAGEDLGIRHFGARALQSLRLEKSFGTWAREYRPIYGPYEAGLDRFIDLRKNDFIGRDAAAKEKQNGPARRLVTLVVDATDADTIGDEPVWHDGKVVGWITSGGYAHYSGKSVALGYVPAARQRQRQVRGRDPRRAAPGAAQPEAGLRSRRRAHARLTALSQAGQFTSFRRWPAARRE